MFYILFFLFQFFLGLGIEVSSISLLAYIVVVLKQALKIKWIKDKQLFFSI